MLANLQIHTSPNINKFSILSMRERECVYFYINGLTAKETAKKLFISPRTVETHLEHVKQKLHCRNKSEIFKAILQKAINDCSLEFLQIEEK